MGEGYEAAGLRWTGHPLPDMGIAGLLAHSRKGEPEEITLGDLEQFAKDSEQWYLSKVLSGYITVLFTSNLINPSFKEDKKRQFLGQLLRVYSQQGDQSLRCVYCGRASVQNADRTLIPMLSGRTQINFYPGGDPSLGLCGLCIVALLALPVGAPFCEGRAVIVEAEDHEVLKAVAKERLEIVQRLISLQPGDKPVNIRGPRTRVIDALVRWQREHAPQRDDVATTGTLTVYHLSNSGQGPDIDIYPLPSAVVRFVMRAQAQAYRHVWSEIARRGWERKRDEEPTEEEKRALRNRFYDSLFNLPDGATSFVRNWFRWSLQEVEGMAVQAFQGRERWPLIRLFLQEVLGMEQARIEAIRKVGDALGQDIVNANDQGLFRRIFMGRTSYREVRGTLIRANNEHVRRNGAPLLTLDDFLLLFEEGEEVARADWQLAWDLLRIRTTETLCKLGWFEKPEAKEVIEEVSQREEEESETAV